jgi:hypothetical protein
VARDGNRALESELIDILQLLNPISPFLPLLTFGDRDLTINYMCLLLCMYAMYECYAMYCYHIMFILLTYAWVCLPQRIFTQVYGQAERLFRKTIGHQRPGYCDLRQSNNFIDLLKAVSCNRYSSVMGQMVSDILWKPRKQNRSIDIHWISLVYHTFKRWLKDIYNI